MLVVTQLQPVANFGHVIVGEGVISQLAKLGEWWALINRVLVRSQLVTANLDAVEVSLFERVHQEVVTFSLFLCHWHHAQVIFKIDDVDENVWVHNLADLEQRDASVLRLHVLELVFTVLHLHLKNLSEEVLPYIGSFLMSVVLAAEKLALAVDPYNSNLVVRVEHDLSDAPEDHARLGTSNKLLIHKFLFELSSL